MNISMKKIFIKFLISFLLSFSGIAFADNYSEVLKNGKLIEYNKSDRIFNNPKNEYTKNLIQSVI